MTTGQFVKAWCLAPLTTPCILMPIIWIDFQRFSEHEAVIGFWTAGFFSWCFSWTATFFFGLPYYIFLAKRQMISFERIAVGGAAIGVVLLSVANFTIGFGVRIEFGLAGCIALVQLGSVFGFTLAITFARIARLI